MLKSVDVLIGLVVVILALSMAVTVITQALTTMVNSRGGHLRRGLADLLQQLDPNLAQNMGQTIADAILRHPLVSASNTPFLGPRLGNVVHREEFTKLVIGLAGGEGATALKADAKAALVATLQANGIADPQATIRNVRTLALNLERTSPELSQTARQNLAILQAAQSDFVAKINNWFDQTMDRTSQRFTASTRAITFVASFIVAFGLQVDTPSVANRLAADDAMRDAFVQQAVKLEEGRLKAVKDAAPAPTSAPAPPERINQEYRAFLLDYGIIRLPTAKGWWVGFWDMQSLLGMLVTALLLSLGAPFWYGVLGKLLQLRSILAVKDDNQRAQRQSNESVSGAASGAGASPQATTVPATLAGERGDLAALG